MSHTEDPEHHDAEQPIRVAHERGDYRAAATLALEAYGRELHAFLVATLASDQDAADVSSELWEMIWKELPRFEWRSSFRTWAYVLARRACHRYRRRAATGRRRTRPLTDSEISRLEQQLRTSVWYLHDSVREGMAVLRERLSDDERALLHLRVDRGLGWREVAELLLGGAVDGKAEARVRQRFARLKERLAKMAAEAGLVPDE